MALEVVNPLLSVSGRTRKGRIVTGTVKGDLHDIDKNHVSSMLEGAGFELIDLGTNVPPEQFVAAAEAQDANPVGISAPLGGVWRTEFQARGLEARRRNSAKLTREATEHLPNKKALRCPGLDEERSEGATPHSAKAPRAPRRPSNLPHSRVLLVPRWFLRRFLRKVDANPRPAVRLLFSSPKGVGVRDGAAVTEMGRRIRSRQPDPRELAASAPDGSLRSSRGAPDPRGLLVSPHQLRVFRQ